MKSIKPEHARILSGISQPMSVDAAFTDAIPAHVLSDRTEEDKKEVVCKVAKMMTVLPNLESVLTITTKSARTSTVGARG